MILKLQRQLFRFSSLIQDTNSKDQFLGLQRKWVEFQEQTKNDKLGAQNDKLSKDQREKIDFLVKNVANLGVLELRYFEQLIRDKAEKKLNLDSVLYSDLKDINTEQLNHQWMEQQEVLSKLWPQGQQGIANTLSSVSGGGGGDGGDAPAQTKSQAKVVEEAPKVKVEKTNFDVQLASFDPANKIKIIKEVREILKLGLKEAKDLVDSAPCTLQKQAKKEDADNLKEKLEALKCQIILL